MVHITRKPGSTAIDLLQPLERRARTLALDLTTMLPNTATGGINDRAGVGLPFAIGGKFHNAQVNTQNATSCSSSGRVGELDRDRQVVAAGHKQQIGFARHALPQLLTLLVAVRQRERMTPPCRGEFRRRRTFHLEAPGIKDNGTARPERVTDRAVGFVAVRNFGKSANGKLRRQAELGANLMVGDFVQVEGPKRLRLPSLLGQPVAGCIEARHGIGKRGGGNIVSTQFYSDRFYKHTDIIPQT